MFWIQCGKHQNILFKSSLYLIQLKYNSYQIQWEKHLPKYLHSIFWSGFIYIPRGIISETMYLITFPRGIIPNWYGINLSIFQLMRNHSIIIPSSFHDHSNYIPMIFCDSQKKRDFLFLFDVSNYVSPKLSTTDELEWKKQRKYLLRNIEREQNNLMFELQNNQITF